MSSFMSLVSVGGGDDLFYALIAPHLDAGSLFCLVSAVTSLRDNHSRVAAVLEQRILLKMEDAVASFGGLTVAAETTYPIGAHCVPNTELVLSNLISGALHAVQNEIASKDVRFSEEVVKIFNQFGVLCTVNHMRTCDDWGYTYGQNPSLGPFVQADQPTTTRYLRHDPRHLDVPDFESGERMKPPVNVGENWYVTHKLKRWNCRVIINKKGILGMFGEGTFGQLFSDFARGFGPLPCKAGTGYREEVAWLS